MTGNDSDTATATTGAPSADLAITKDGSVPTVVAGGQVTYTIAVENGGPSDVADATVTDVLPAGATLVDSSSSRGTAARSPEWCVRSVRCPSEARRSSR